jgi:hypothetical protein
VGTPLHLVGMSQHWGSARQDGMQPAWPPGFVHDTVPAGHAPASPMGEQGGGTPQVLP